MSAAEAIVQALKDSRQWGDDDITAVEVLQALGRNGYAVVPVDEVERLQAERDRIMAAAKELLDREKSWHAESEAFTSCVDEYCTDWPCPAEKLRRAFEANGETA